MGRMAGERALEIKSVGRPEYGSLKKTPA